MSRGIVSKKGQLFASGDCPEGKRLDRGPGAHHSPQACFIDAIERSLGWAAEDELRAVVERYTGFRMSLGDCDRFSQEVAAIVVKALINPKESKT